MHRTRTHAHNVIQSTQLITPSLPPAVVLWRQQMGLDGVYSADDDLDGFPPVSANELTSLVFMLYYRVVQKQIHAR